MEINRNNYEEYFLMYADNELSLTEKKVVDIFVQENADLKEEFFMIQLTVNAPDTEIQLSDKSFLLKKESLFINENNVEEVFVLYHDNELSDSQRAMVDAFVENNSNYKTQFEFLGKARMTADMLVAFPNRKLLYKKVSTEKAIPLFFWRAMAAAVLIGFGLWVSVSYFNKVDVVAPAIARQASTVKQPKVEEPMIASGKPIEKEDKLASATKAIKPARIIKTEVETIKPIVAESKINDSALRKPVLAIKTPVYKEVNTERASQLVAITAPLEVTPVIANNLINTVPENTTLASINNNEPATQKVNYIDDATTENQNYVFYKVSAEEFRKSKVGGFLKKVKRIVKRNNPLNRLFAGDEEEVAINN